MSDLPDLEAVCDIAARASDAILEVYHRADIEVQRKADDSPLTAADLAANRCILAGLRDLAPDLPIISEESAHTGWRERRAWPRYWLVDPLDGTREFVKRNGEFTVNIALIDDHRSVLGVVMAPVTGDSYFASVDVGAWLRRGGGGKVGLHTRTPTTPFVVASSRSHAGERQQRLLAPLGEYTSVAMGSSLKFCLIAAGQADVYLRAGATSEWDTAAAQCVLEQAGGAVLALDGTPLAYNTKDSLINPEFLAVGDRSRDWTARLGQ